MKRLRTFITEAVRSAKLYHVTEFGTSIIRAGYITIAHLDETSDESLNKSISKRSVKSAPDVGHISFTRSIGGHYTNSVINWAAVVWAFEFDAAKLKSKYQVKPVDFFKGGLRKFGEDEQEERLVSKDHSMPIDPFLTAVHIYISAESVDDEDNRPNMLRDQLVGEMKSLKVPAYLYHTMATFKAGRFAEAEQINPRFFDHDDED